MSSGNVKKCAVGKHPKSEKHGNTAQFSEVERSGTKKASKKSAVTPTASLRGAEQGSFFRVSALFCCCSK